MSSGQASVVLFDIPSNTKENCWSLNIWRIRYLLNYKKISHTTRWVEFPDIKPLFIELGVPAIKTAFGDHAYTCPTIQYFPADGSPPIFVTDSYAIAPFLEERHPDPPVFSKMTASVEEQTELGWKVRTELLLPIFPIIARGTCHALNEASQPYFRETREKNVFKKKLEEWGPSDEQGIKDALATAKKQFDEYLKTFPNAGPYLFGQEISYLDMIFASVFMWIKVVAKEELWSQMREWDGGKWEKLLETFEEKGYSKLC